MRGPAQAGATDEIPRMQEGVRDWARQAARPAGDGLDGSPGALLSLLCASAFCPLLMAGGAAAADIAVLFPADGRALAQAVTDALARQHGPGQAGAPSRDELRNGDRPGNPAGAGGRRPACGRAAG